jgi:Na+-translocating ferredoxin:NAD+ oxidoreductase subunit B
VSAAPHASLTETLDALLPQTQCGQCGYKGCLPYAEAMAAGAADINRCPPGGDVVIVDLAHVLQRAPKPLDSSCGESKAPAVALIDETWCIGCTLCIQACPVDAIAGAAKVMHTVIANECTGCELCIPPCPVDCILMVAVHRHEAPKERHVRAAQYRGRYLAREKRLVGGKQLKTVSAAEPLTAQDGHKQSAVQRALARAQRRIQGKS